MLEITGRREVQGAIGGGNVGEDWSWNRDAAVRNLGRN